MSEMKDRVYGLDLSADLIQWMPTEFKESPEIIKIMDSENPEFSLMAERILHWLDNLYPGTAHIEGIELFEYFLGLEPQLDDTLEDRRMRIISKLNERLPYTFIRLHRMVAALVGWGNFEMYFENGGRLLFRLKSPQENDSRIKAVLELFENVVPMNLYWEFKHHLLPFETKEHLGVGAVIHSELETPPADERIHRRYSPLCASIGTQVRLRVVTD